MDYLELMKERHSVRKYKDLAISAEDVHLMREKIKEVNEKSGMRFRLILNEDQAFAGLIPKYGWFKNARNYIICSGEASAFLDEKIGYYGEELVLYAQSLGLNTCWVGGTVNRNAVKARMDENERLGCVIVIGYGQTQGVSHKNKDVRKMTDVASPWPQWFKDGMLGAMLAPTALNQQQFYVTMTQDGRVNIRAKRGFFNQVDLGIVKYQFEMAAGPDFPGFAR